MDEIKKWMEKINDSKSNLADLSRDEDLSIAIMNLVSLEEHFYFTAMKTNDAKYLDMLNSIRELRKTLLAKVVKNPKGEEWCISKHLLASSMRLIEVGTKELPRSREEASFCFKSAFDLYSLFFAINMGIIDSKELKITEAHNGKAKNGMMEKFSMIVKKIVDCCKE